MLVCTAENDVVLLAQARLAGADGCLLKPFDKGHVGAALRQVGLAELKRGYVEPFQRSSVRHRA